MIFVNQFFKMLKDSYPHFITQQQFETALRDEEFIDGDSLLCCFACSDEDQKSNTNTSLIEGKSQIFQYIESKINEYKSFIQIDSYVLKINFLQYAKHWLHSENYFEDSYSIKDEDIKAIVCNRCGNILGFIIKGITKYIYFGYLDDVREVKQDLEYEFAPKFTFNNQSNNINYDDIIKNINTYKKINLLKQLDENKNKLNEMTKNGKKDPNDYIPLLRDTLRKIKNLNDIL